MHTSVASMGIADMILLVWDRKGLFPARGVERFKSAFNGREGSLEILLFSPAYNCMIGHDKR
jgi:hypothetical protein